MEDELLIVRNLDNSRSLCVSTLSRKAFEAYAAEMFISDQGLFLYERDESLGGEIVDVLAKVSSFDAALRLASLWQSQAASAA